MYYNGLVKAACGVHGQCLIKGSRQFEFKLICLLKCYRIQLNPQRPVNLRPAAAQFSLSPYVRKINLLELTMQILFYVLFQSCFPPILYCYTGY